ncbi:uncharacterized protein PHALS_15120 [Plasmopara halstedii]|uniref:Uncharacterized protein n=1 Tax=Plasmopara halstedii TaxID=4781 RepID=A0A0P1B8Z0_PLAHL|nr:uncharacterized protein PHALS_15120 [Plasmopara halstedii]CEG50498.1 hypothetical protein PHALS_15120 [Plasmopara halstedii]|eukprot:XP_024586867.1 hypothetical protein PHALS_15120 [Plasmopara halstedii]
MVQESNNHESGQRVEAMYLAMTATDLMIASRTSTTCCAAGTIKFLHNLRHGEPWHYLLTGSFGRVVKNAPCWKN